MKTRSLKQIFIIAVEIKKYLKTRNNNKQAKENAVLLKMPHSESQLIGDMVKESNSAIVRQMLPKTVNEQNEKIIVPRPPLPPNIAVKNAKGRLANKLLPHTTAEANESIPLADTTDLKPKILSNWSKRNPKIILEKCVGKLSVTEKCNIDIDEPCDNNNNFKPLSRNSSIQSIDSLSSFRSISPTLSLHSSIGSFNSRQSLGSLTPRRIYPQAYKPSRTIDLSELKKLDSASTVFDGKLSFVFGCKRQPVRQEFRSSAAHLSEADTASRYLSDQISDFLKRTDHVADEWNNRCKSVSRNSISRASCDLVDDETNRRLGRSKSVTNIMIKGYQLTKNMPPTERSNSVCRERSNSVLTDIIDRKNSAEDECTIIDDEVTVWIRNLIFAFHRDSDEGKGCNRICKTVHAMFAIVIHFHLGFCRFLFCSQLISRNSYDGQFYNTIFEINVEQINLFKQFISFYLSRCSFVVSFSRVFYFIFACARSLFFYIFFRLLYLLWFRLMCDVDWLYHELNLCSIYSETYSFYDFIHGIQSMSLAIA